MDDSAYLLLAEEGAELLASVYHTPAVKRVYLEEALRHIRAGKAPHVQYYVCSKFPLIRDVYQLAVQIQFQYKVKVA